MKHCLPSELREAACNVHFPLGLLEGLAVEVGSKSFADALGRIGLVDEGEADRLLEGETEEIVMLGSHQDEKQGDVGAFSSTIPIQVDADAHAVSMWAGLEGGAVQTDGLAIQRVPISPSDVWDLPDEDAVCGLDVLHVLSQSKLVHGNAVLRDVLLDALHILLETGYLVVVPLHILTEHVGQARRTLSSVIKALKI